MESVFIDIDQTLQVCDDINPMDTSSLSKVVSSVHIFEWQTRVNI